MKDVYGHIYIHSVGGMTVDSCKDAPSPASELINKAFNITTAYMYSVTSEVIVLHSACCVKTCVCVCVSDKTDCISPFQCLFSVLSSVPPPSLSFPPSFPSHLTSPLFFRLVAPVGYLGSWSRAAVWPLWRAVNKNTLPPPAQLKLYTVCIPVPIWSILTDLASSQKSTALLTITFRATGASYSPLNTIISHLPSNTADKLLHNSSLKGIAWPKM